jgi:hypothetical protein
LAKTRQRIESKLEDELTQVAEGLIVKGKEQGYLRPDNILESFPEVESEPNHVFRVFRVFTEMGIEFTDGDKDFEQVRADRRDAPNRHRDVGIGPLRRPGAPLSKGDRPGNPLDMTPRRSSSPRQLRPAVLARR